MRSSHLLLPLVFSVTILHAQPEAFEVGPLQTNALPRGKEADGIIGDFVLRNDQIEAVISGNQPQRRANMSTFYNADGITPGCLYDLALLGSNNDQLTIFAPCAQKDSVSWVRAFSKNGSAFIECAVTGATHLGLARYHQYELKDGWRGIQITSTFVNESTTPQTVPLADKWTNFVRTGAALGIAWADVIDPADRAGYAYAVTQAPAGFTPTKPRVLAPGESLTFSRFIAVGHSSLEAFGAVAAQRGPIGQIQGSLHDSAGAPVTTAQILVRTTGDFDATVGVATPDLAGHFQFSLPPGRYALTLSDLGRSELEQTLEVSANQTSPVEVTMSQASALSFDIRDGAGKNIPCKAQFIPLANTAPLNLGPQNRAHGCVDQYHSENGQFRVQLPPGQYKVIVTRGIEFSHFEQEVTLGPGATIALSATLQRLVDTTGWVSADYHNHSTQSGDNTCSTADRLINLAAEQIEFAPTTEHNRLYDWRPLIDQLGLASFLQTVPGLELTGSYSHLNSFPFQPVPFTQDNGAPVWNKDPRIAAITLRDWQGAEPDRWIQINHPEMEIFTDADRDGKPDGGFLGLASLIDGIETQNGDSSAILGGVPYRIGKDKTGAESVRLIREFIWLQMLNRGHRYAATAVCDAHSVYGNGVGAWRVYLPSHSDEPPKSIGGKIAATPNPGIQFSPLAPSFRCKPPVAPVPETQPAPPTAKSLCKSKCNAPIGSILTAFRYSLMGARIPHSTSPASPTPPGLARAPSDLPSRSKWRSQRMPI